MPGSKKPERVSRMSSDQISIKVENLNKCYEIYESPRDRLKQFIYPRIQRIFGKKAQAHYREFWALQNISFEIKKGESFGIIGSNGSGKSTLLQLICGTLTPTSGTVQTNGKIAALLELGSGFNPEFTGRENVYLNAAMLGLTKDEIDLRFDDISSFADIGQFIDQPVKTYSSGMFVRLAFAVIAHVDADILIIDEALAVGDTVFTQKCMRFIRKFQETGSLIFVSHDSSAVQNLCKQGIWLKHGKVELIGSAKKVSEAYMQFTLQEIYGQESRLISISPETTDQNKVAGDLESIAPPLINYEPVAIISNNIDFANGWKTGKAEIISVNLTNLSSNLSDVYRGGESVRLTVRAKANERMQNPILGFLVRDKLGQDLFGENTLPFTSNLPTPVNSGEIFDGIFEFILPMLPNGQFAVMASVAEGELYNNTQHHWMHDALIIHVSSSKVRWGLVGISFNKAELKVINNG